MNEFEVEDVNAATTTGSGAGSMMPWRVRQIELRSWPDHGVPDDAGAMLRLVQLADDMAAGENEASSRPGPPVVHCSAGVGRTGTFIALSALVRAFAPRAGTSSKSVNTSTPTTPRSWKDPHAGGSSAQGGSSTESAVSQLRPAIPSALACDPVLRVVDALRDQRTTMVQTREQLAFVYTALAQAVAEMSAAAKGNSPARATMNGRS